MVKSKEWKAIPGAHLSDADAAIYGPRIQEIADTYGYVEPEQVVEDARSKDSPLHAWFDWSDKSAAKEWRLCKARNLIASISVVITVKEDKVPIRAFHNVVVKSGTPEETKNAYVSLTAVQKSEDYGSQIVHQALKEYQSLGRRYANYKELFPIFAAVKAITDSLFKPEEECEPAEATAQAK